MITEPVTFLLYNANAVVIALTHGWAPFAILPIYVSLEKIDRSLLEASKDLGDNAIQQFFRVILPLSAPGVIGAALIIFIPTVGDYITPKLVHEKFIFPDIIFKFISVLMVVASIIMITYL